MGFKVLNHIPAVSEWWGQKAVPAQCEYTAYAVHIYNCALCSARTGSVENRRHEKTKCKGFIGVIDKSITNNSSSFGIRISLPQVSKMAYERRRLFHAEICYGTKSPASFGTVTEECNVCNSNVYCAGMIMITLQVRVLQPIDDLTRRVQPAETSLLN